MDNREVLPPGTLLDGSYRIKGVVGSGGFGITYEADEINLGTVVAVKEYYPLDFGERAAVVEELAAQPQDPALGIDDFCLDVR